MYFVTLTTNAFPSKEPISPSACTVCTVLSEAIILSRRAPQGSEAFYGPHTQGLNFQQISQKGGGGAGREGGREGGGGVGRGGG